MVNRIMCWLGLGLGLLSGSGAWAQSIGRAVVYQVPAPGEASRFQVPQVRLADAAVARHINQKLLSRALDEEERPVASPQRRVYLAARECCYDADNRMWAAAGGGLTGSEYTVLLNRSGLLSLRLIKQYTGNNHSFEIEYFTFDLRTGRLLAVADLVADPPAQLVRRMQGAINRRYGEALNNAVEEGVDSVTLAEMAEHFYWDWSARRVRWFVVGDTSAATQVPNLPYPDIETFALTPTALLLFHSAGFHRLSQAPAPDETYRFPYSHLQVRPLLKPLLPAARPAAAPKR